MQHMQIIRDSLSSTQRGYHIVKVTQIMDCALPCSDYVRHASGL